MKSKVEINDLKSKKVAELLKLEQEKRKELALLGVATKFGRNKNMAELRKIRKSIARIKTLINIAITQSAKADGGSNG